MNEINEKSEKEKIAEITELLTDEVAYRVYILSTFRELTHKLNYQQGLLENHAGELSDISGRMDTLLQEHAVCTKRVADTHIYEDTWKWTKRVREIWMTVTQKVAVWLLLAVIVLLAYLYLTHVKTPTINPPVVPAPQMQGSGGGE